MKDTENQFSEWFKTILAQKGMNAAEFAARSGVSKAAAYFYLDGSRTPGEAQLSKICTALEITRAEVPAFTRPKAGRPAKK